MSLERPDEGACRHTLKLQIDTTTGGTWATNTRQFFFGGKRTSSGEVSLRHISIGVCTAGQANRWDRQCRQQTSLAHCISPPITFDGRDVALRQTGLLGRYTRTGGLEMAKLSHASQRHNKEITAWPGKNKSCGSPGKLLDSLHST